MLDPVRCQELISVFLHQLFFRREVLDGVLNQPVKYFSDDLLALACTHGSVEFAYDFEQPFVLRVHGFDLHAVAGVPLKCTVHWDLPSV